MIYGKKVILLAQFLHHILLTKWYSIGLWVWGFFLVLFFFVMFFIFYRFK